MEKVVQYSVSETPLTKEQMEDLMGKRVYYPKRGFGVIARSHFERVIVRFADGIIDVAIEDYVNGIYAHYGDQKAIKANSFYLATRIYEDLCARCGQAVSEGMLSVCYKCRESQGAI